MTTQNKKVQTQQSLLREKALYKAEQKKRMALLQANKKDYNGNDIVKIYVKSEEYAVYEIKAANLADSLKVYIDTEDEEDSKGIIRNFDQIRGCLAEFKSCLHKVQEPQIYKTRASHLISQALFGNIKEAKDQFFKLTDDINQQYSDQFKFRLRYLVTALLFVLLNILVSLVVYCTEAFSNFRHIEDFVYIGTAGSLGGFLSISRRINKTVFEKEITKYMFNVYALERIFISIFASFVVYFAIQCNVVFGLTKKLEYPIFGYILFSIVAGFSETLIPNLLIKFETKTQ